MPPAPSSSRNWVLRSRPEGSLSRDDFELVRRPLPSPAEGEVVVRVDYLAMDPAIRGFMNDSGSYVAPIETGQPIKGMVLGTVIASRAPNLLDGTIVWGFVDWGEHAVVPAANMHRAVGCTVPEPDLLHRRGTIGLTAYYGLAHVGGLRKGERVLISGASGAVGSLAGQMARELGASRVVGIAGGPEKCRRAVETYGYDACIDYKSVPDLAAALATALPDGIDVYFDNVGGAALAAAVDMLRKNARIALCGMISTYDRIDGGTACPNLWNMVVQTAAMRGFRISEMLRDENFVAEALGTIDGWIAAGRLRADFDIRNGLEEAPAAFLSLFSGGNAGRLLVSLRDSA